MLTNTENSRTYQALSWGLCVLFVTLAFVGVIKNYSPVPYWDMWDGYLGFFQQWQSGNSSAWWAQHNEHRLLLARLFFWADLQWFQGTGASLLALNLLLVTTTCVVFHRFLQTPAFRDISGLTAPLVAWLFSWAQYENLVWAFQCQFIMAQLLPFAALYFLQGSSRANREDGSWRFTAACALGLAAIGTMANGVLILPLMTVSAAWLRMGWRRTAILAALSALAWGAYFHGYALPAKAEAINPLPLAEQLVEWVGFFTCYLGGPFKHLLSALNVKGSLNAASIVMGSLMLLTWGLLVLREVRSVTRSPERVTLLVFVLFVFAGGAATTLARSALGLDQATASRYSTPTLMAWAALWICLAPRNDKGAPAWSPRSPQAFKFLLLIVLLLSIPLQMRATASRSAELFERKTGALAATLGVKDKAQIERLYPDMNWVLTITTHNIKSGTSIFGAPPLLGLDQIWQRNAPAPIGALSCAVNIERIEPIEGQQGQARVHGVVRFNDAKDRISATREALIVTAPSSGQVVSIALFDVGDPLEQLGTKRRKALTAHFSGYARALPASEPLSALVGGHLCAEPVQISVEIPRIKVGSQ
jgi:hypothetical protein